MKVKREEWEALQRRVKALETELIRAHHNTMTQVKTGEVLTSVVVLAILQHLKVDFLHGCGIAPKHDGTCTGYDARKHSDCYPGF